MTSVAFGVKRYEPLLFTYSLLVTVVVFSEPQEKNGTIGGQKQQVYSSFVINDSSFVIKSFAQYIYIFQFGTKLLMITSRPML